MEGGQRLGQVLDGAHLEESPTVRPAAPWFGPCPSRVAYLSALLVNHVEDSVAFGVPEKAVADALPSQLAGDDLEQVHLDGLLHKHHVILRHGCGGWRGLP